MTKKERTCLRVRREALADVIRARRKSLGLTQLHMANVLKVTRSRYCQFENGMTTLPTQYIAPVAKELGVSEQILAKRLVCANDPHLFRILWPGDNPRTWRLERE